MKSDKSGCNVYNVINGKLDDQSDSFVDEIKLSDYFAELRDICDLDCDFDPVEIRDMIRERRL